MTVVMVSWVALVMGALCVTSSLSWSGRSAAAAAIADFSRQKRQLQDASAFDPDPLHALYENTGVLILEVVLDLDDKTIVLDSGNAVRVFDSDGERVLALNLGAAAVGYSGPRRMDSDTTVIATTQSKFVDPVSGSEVLYPLVVTVIGTRRNAFAGYSDRMLDAVASHPTRARVATTAYQVLGTNPAGLPQLNDTQVALFEYNIDGPTGVISLRLLSSVDIEDTSSHQASSGESTFSELAWSFADTNKLYVMSRLSNKIHQLTMSGSVLNPTDTFELSGCGLSTIMCTPSLFALSHDGARFVVSYVQADLSARQIQVVIEVVETSSGDRAWTEAFVALDNVFGALAWHSNNEWIAIGPNGINANLSQLRDHTDGKVLWQGVLDANPKALTQWKFSNSSSSGIFVVASGDDVNTQGRFNVTVYSETGGRVTVAPTTDPDDDPVCFPASSTVRTRDRGIVRMGVLQVGEYVLTDLHTYEKVLFFGHRVERGRFGFMRLEWRDAVGKSGALSLSATHKVLVDGQMVAAASAKVGHMLHLVDAERDRVELVRIECVEEVDAPGLYNPHTASGQIIVDGIVASCYTTSMPDHIAHALLGPVRLVEWMLGSRFALNLGYIIVGKALEGRERCSVLARAHDLILRLSV